MQMVTTSKYKPIARMFKAAGADMIDCSSGQVSKQQKPVYGRMYQTPFADRIRNEAGIATIAVGAISEADHVNSTALMNKVTRVGCDEPASTNCAIFSPAPKNRYHGAPNTMQPR